VSRELGLHLLRQPLFTYTLAPSIPYTSACLCTCLPPCLLSTSYCYLIMVKQNTITHKCRTGTSTTIKPLPLSCHFPCLLPPPHPASQLTTSLPCPA